MASGKISAQSVGKGSVFELVISAESRLGNENCEGRCTESYSPCPLGARIQFGRGENRVFDRVSDVRTIRVHLSAKQVQNKGFAIRDAKG